MADTALKPTREATLSSSALCPGLGDEKCHKGKDQKRTGQSDDVAVLHSLRPPGLVRLIGRLCKEKGQSTLWRSLGWRLSRLLLPTALVTIHAYSRAKPFRLPYGQRKKGATPHDA